MDRGAKPRPRSRPIDALANLPPPRMDDQTVDRSIDRIEEAIESLLRLHASRKVHAKRIEAAGVDVSAAGYLLLQRIQEEGPISLGELARRADMDPAVTTRQVHQLEREGYVRRSDTPDDGRVTLVSVTPEGSRARQRITEVMDQHMIDVLDRWSSADRRRLADLLGRLIDDLRESRLRSMDERRSR